MPYPLDPQLLRSFVAIADSGSITVAARMVNRSQGAVSQQLKRLETRLGRPLFDRTPGGLRLTRDGQRLLPRAAQLLSLSERFMDGLGESEFSGEIRIGVAYDLVAGLLPAPLREFRSRCPDVRVSLTSAHSLALTQALEAGTIDIAVTTDRTQPGDGETLFRDRLCWTGAQNGTAARERPLTVALSHECCAFRSCSTDALARSRIDWRPICQAGGLEAVHATLAADMAVAPFLSRTIPAPLRRIEDAGLPDLPEFHIVLRERHGARTPVMAVLREILLESLDRPRSPAGPQLASPLAPA